jgi:hypothetical protein
MIMLFVYVEDACVIVPFTVPRARDPLGSWPTWSDTQFGRHTLISFHLHTSRLSSSAQHPHTRAYTVGRKPLRLSAEQAVNKYQGQSACLAVPCALLCARCGDLCPRMSFFVMSLGCVYLCLLHGR